MNSPPEIAKVMCEVGVKKSQMPIRNMFILGILAGVYIGFGSQLMTVVTQDLSAHVGLGFASFIGGSVFTVGLMLVVIGGAELFTGNCLMVNACASKMTSWKGLLKNWTVVYLGNFVGSILLAVIVFFGFYYGTDTTSTMGIRAIGIANIKVNLSFVTAIARGIGCNWLVCLAVWLAASSKDISGKVWAIFFPIMAFVAIGFEHSVANMYFISQGLLVGELPAYASLATSNLTVSGFLFNNLLPVTIGNIIGGAIFVGIFYWMAYIWTPKAPPSTP